MHRNRLAACLVRRDMFYIRDTCSPFSLYIRTLLFHFVSHVTCNLRMSVIYQSRMCWYLLPYPMYNSVYFCNEIKKNIWPKNSLLALYVGVFILIIMLHVQVTTKLRTLHLMKLSGVKIRIYGKVPYSVKNQHKGIFKIM